MKLFSSSYNYPYKAFKSFEQLLPFVSLSQKDYRAYDGFDFLPRLFEFSPGGFRIFGGTVFGGRYVRTDEGYWVHGLNYQSNLIQKPKTLIFAPISMNNVEEVFYSCSDSQELVNKAIFLGGSVNFGHFLFEMFPKVLMLQASGIDTKSFTMLLPSGFPSYWLDIFTFFGIEFDNFFYLDEGSRLHADELLIVGSPAHRHLRTPCINEYVYRAVRLRAEKVLYSAKVPLSTSPKIYFTRESDQFRHITNQGEISTLLEKYGFIKFQPVEHSFLEQVGAMMRASHIFMPLGGGSPLSMFSNLSGIFFDITTDRFQGDFGARVWATIHKFRYKRLTGIADPSSNSGRLPSDYDFYLDPSVLQRLLRLYS